MDLELRDAERRLATLKARTGGQSVIRPTGVEELPPDPWDGEERFYSFSQGGYLRATGDMRIQFGSVLSSVNGEVRPDPNLDVVNAVRVIALLKEKVWLGLSFSGTWTLS